MCLGPLVFYKFRSRGSVNKDKCTVICHRPKVEPVAYRVRVYQRVPLPDSMNVGCNFSLRAFKTSSQVIGFMRGQGWILDEISTKTLSDLFCVAER